MTSTSDSYAKSLATSLLSGAMLKLRVAAYSISPDQKFAAFISPSIGTITGHPTETLVANPSLWLEWIHPDDREFVASYFASVLPGEAYDLCYRIIHQKGATVSVRDTGFFRQATTSEASRYEGLIWELGGSFVSLFGSGESLSFDDALARAIPDLWLVFDGRGRILHCKPGLDVQPVRPAGEIIGLPVGEVLPPDLAKVVEENVGAGELRLHEYKLDYGAAGTRWFEARFSPMGPGRCLVIVRDISERRTTNQALEIRNAILAAISACAQQFLQQPVQIDFSDFVKGIGAAAAVDRCFVFQNRVDPASGQLLYRQIAEWCRPGVASQLSNDQLYDIAYEEVGFGEIAGHLATGQVLTLNPDDLPEPARSILVEQQILTLVLAPIFVGGEWWGFFGFDECVQRREWQQAEKDMLAGASALLGLALQQKQQQQELLEREEKFRTVFENAPVPIVLTSGDSDQILEANRQALECFSSLNHLHSEVCRFSDLFEPGTATPEPSEVATVHWALTSHQPHPYLITSQQLVLREGRRTAWFFQSLQESYEKKREAWIHRQLLSALASANGLIAVNPGGPECPVILAQALMETGLLAAVAGFPIVGASCKGGLCLVAKLTPGLTLETATGHYQAMTEALLSSPAHELTLRNGLPLMLSGPGCQPPTSPLLSPANPVHIYPVNRHNSLFALLIVEWDSTVGPLPANAPLLNFAEAFSRCAEAGRIAAFNQTLKAVSTAAASADSVADLLRLACRAILAEEIATCAVGYLRTAPDDNTYRVCLKTATQSIVIEEIPERVAFSASGGTVPWLKKTDSVPTGIAAQDAVWLSERIVLDESKTADLYVLLSDRLTGSSWIQYVLSSVSEIVVSGYRALSARNTSRLAERKLESMLQFASVFQILMNRDGCLVQMNSYVRQLLYSAGIEVAPGDSLYRILVESEQDLLRFAIDAAATGSKVPICVEIARLGAEPLVIEGYLSTTEDDSELLEWVGLDVTEQRASRTNLRLLEECFEQTQSAAAITRLEDGHSIIVEANAAFREQMGESRGWPLLRNTSIAKLLGLPESQIPSFVKPQVSVSQQIYNQHMKRWFEVVVTPVSVEWSAKLHYVWIFSDVTREKQIATNLAKALLHEQETHEVKSRLIATSSHEFRTPLAVINSSVDLLERYAGATPLVRDQALWQKIRNAVHRMALMIERVLEIEKADPTGPSGQLAPVLLQEVASEVMVELNAAYPLARPIQWESPSEQVWVLDDGQTLRLILSNLLMNARKYSSPEGNVSLRIEIQSGIVLITVSDDGIGIPKKDLHTIFDPFTRGSNTSQIPGTGVGLAIVKHAVKKLQGKVSLDSVEGAGTTVRLQFNRATAFPADLSAKGNEQPKKL